MMNWLLSPLTKYALIALAALSFVGGIYLAGRHNGVKSMQPKLEAAKSEAELWQKTADNRKTLIEAQNQAIAQIKALNDAKVLELKKNLATAVLEGQKAAQQAKKNVNTLYSLELPKNECEALFSLVDTANRL